MAGKSSVVVRFLGDTMSLEAAARRASASMETVGKKGQSMSTALNTMGTAGVAAVAAVGVAAVKMGVDWQKQMTTLQTGAGETKANIDLVSHGLLDMAGTVGTSATELAKGMYMVESAGYHGAAGLQVLQAAAEGAKVGNADMATVANAVTSALNAYHLKATESANVTNTLIATVATGKMKMDDLATALGNVLPVAATSGISLKEVGGALATMTMQGVDANTAATYLRQTISKLQAPTKAQADEFNSLGLNAVEMSQNIGKRGLAGTLDILTQAIVHKMGPGGLIMIEHLKKMAAHTNTFQKALLQLPPTAQTYVAALATAMGGTKTLQGALLLTGKNMTAFKNNVKSVGAAVEEGGGKIRGWSEVQADLATQVDQVREGIKAWLTELGTQLIPILQNVINFVKQHSDAAKTLATVIAGVLAFSIAWRIATLALAGVQAVISAVTTAWTAAQWLLNAALTANPIGLIIAGIALLIAAVVLAYQHVGWFRTGVDAALSGVRVAFAWLLTAVKAVFNWIKDHWQLLLAILTGPIGLAILWVKNNWSTVTTIFSNVLSGIRGVLGGVVSVITAPFRTAFNMVADLWNGTLGHVSFQIPSWVPGIGGNGFSFPQMPHLATGGTAIRSGLALVGEHGPEILSMPRGASVIPLSKAGGMGQQGPLVGHLEVHNHYPTDTGQSVEHGLRKAAFLLGVA